MFSMVKRWETGTWQTAPLRAAAYGYHTDAVSSLIPHGANVHLADKNGWLPLYCVAGGGGISFVNHVNGCDITAVDKRGRTVLHLAARSDHCKELIEYLICHETQRAM